MKKTLYIALCCLASSAAITAAERTVALSALLAPVEFNVESRDHLDVEITEETAPKEKVKYVSISLLDVLAKMEDYYSVGLTGKERLSFQSKMRFTNRRIKETSWWDVQVKEPFTPDRNGRWYPLVDLMVDGKVVSTLRMPIHVSHFKEVWALNQNMARGALLNRGALEAKVVDIYDQRTPPIPSMEVLSAYELDRTLSRGKVLTWDDLKPQPQVRRNSIIDVVVQQGALSIRMRARAMEDGLLGDIVAVRNLDTSREFFAAVSGKNTVEFKL